MEGPSDASARPEATDARAMSSDDTRERAGAEDAAVEGGKRKLSTMDEDEEKRSVKFMEVLMGNIANPGILRKRRKSGIEHVPIMHQRRAVKFMLPPSQSRAMLVHDPGLGKTFTTLLLVAALHVVHRGSKSELKFLISVPASCIEQWYREVTEALLIPPKMILKTNRVCHLTKEAIAAHTLIIVSRDTVGRAFSACHEYVTAHHLNSLNRWVSAWDRIAGTDMHPLFEAKFALVAVDELHYMRNSITAWTRGHELLCKRASKAVGLTATPVFNSPKDLCGISTALDLSDSFKSQTEWFVDREKSRVNVATIKRMNSAYVHRADDSILNLPPITHEIVNFDVNVHREAVFEYNKMLAVARRIRFSMERNGRSNRDDMKKLMSCLQIMQQFLVSPLLAEKGAKEIKEDPDLLCRAAAEDTGALQALRDNLLSLKGRGFARVMVAACHTSLLKIAQIYLRDNCPELGDVLLYDGSLSQTKRNKVTSSFLGGENTVLLMSIDAGGTGLHLVPGANAVVFWGSRPFSPMQVLQTSKRVHRIGQDFPVVVLHLIATGSVDFAINLVHGDKLTLSNAVIDCETDNLEESGGKWRTTGRIVDGCRFLNEDGIFPEVEITEEEAMRMAQAHEAQQGDSVEPGGDVASLVQNALNADPVLPPLPQSVAQALLQNAAILSTGALEAISFHA